MIVLTILADKEATMSYVLLQISLQNIILFSSFWYQNYHTLAATMMLYTLCTERYQPMPMEIA
jgi:hypothetical protein